jgi:hypothetical protein
VSIEQPHRPAESLGDLFSDLSKDLSALLRDEIRLAKVEITEDAKGVARAGGLLGGAAFAGYVVILLLSFAAAWGLAELLPIGVAFLIVGLVWAVIGAVLYSVGKKGLTEANLKPEQTIETMQENIQWAKQQTS